MIKIVITTVIITLFLMFGVSMFVDQTEKLPYELRRDNNYE